MTLNSDDFYTFAIKDDMCDFFVCTVYTIYFNLDAVLDSSVLKIVNLDRFS